MSVYIPSRRKLSTEEAKNFRKNLGLFGIFIIVLFALTLLCFLFNFSFMISILPVLIVFYIGFFAMGCFATTMMI